MTKQRSKNPRVSIALCTYNGEKFLSQQLDTLINQTYLNVELVISDDNSTDNTYDILEKYKKNHPEIKLIRNKDNLGFIKNFEQTIKMCNGDYICLCDQDDIWSPFKVELLIENIGNSILIYHNSDFIGQDGIRIGYETMANKYNMYDGSSSLPFLLSNCVSGHATMFAKRLIPYILPFDKNFYHDWWIAYAAFSLNETTKYLDEILVSYRQHSDSITDNFKFKEESNKTSNNRIPVDLAWIKKCSEYEFNYEPKLIKNAYHLFRDTARGKNRLSLFIFLLKYYDLILYKHRPNKGLLSKINYIRKLCFEKDRFFFK